MLSYNAEIISESQKNYDSLIQMLEWEKTAFNEASQTHFKRFVDGKPNSIIFLHAAFYKKFRNQNPEIPAQIVIIAENECLGTYRSIKSNKHKIEKPPQKTNLSLRLDKRLYSKTDSKTIRITTANKRQTFKIKTYPKLDELLEKHQHRDPLLFIKNGKLYISLVFDIVPKLLPQKLALGVDLGVKVTAACSDGRLIRSKSFNARKRKIRHNKRELQSKVTKSARRKLKKLRNKERNMTKNYSHHVTNEILKTNADTIVLENLKGIKKGRGKRGTKQVPFYELKQIITYKAALLGKRVILVSPTFTSQTDPITGHKTGKRKGRRFYSNNGLVYDSDISASWNIAKRSKLPYLQKNLLAGQALVTEPIVCKPSRQKKEEALQALEFIP